MNNYVGYYVTDHLGSTRAVVDDAGTVLETFDYYPFGLLMPKRNTAGANTIEKFTGKERDTEGNLNLDYFGARYYDPALGRWHSPDPLAGDYPGWSSYNYTLNNPIAFVDPDGRFVSPIYNRDGELLGTDDEGLQGEAIILNEEDFTQGMSHEEALKKDLGTEGLNSQSALDRFNTSYEGLSSRPDYDGKLTLSEANEWYRNGGGKPLFADLGKIDLSSINKNDFNTGNKLSYINLLFRGNKKDGLVYGSIGLQYLGNQKVKGTYDEYDFRPRDWDSIRNIVRNIETIGGRMRAGSGNDYFIRFYGNGKISLPPSTPNIANYGSY